MRLGAPTSVQLPLFDAPAPPPVAAAPSRTSRYIDRSEQLPLWETSDSVHLTQYASTRLPDGHPNDAMNGNCGPAAAVMALRLVGLDLPGYHGEDSQRALDVVRYRATGRLDQSEWLTNLQLDQYLRDSGAQVDLTTSPTEALRAVREGKVLLALGNVNADDWWMRPWSYPNVPAKEWAGHFVVVSGYQPDRDMYTLNDPSSEHVLHVSGRQLQSFMHQSAREGHDQLIVDGPGNVVRNAATEQAVEGVSELAPA